MANLFWNLSPSNPSCQQWIVAQQSTCPASDLLEPAPTFDGFGALFDVLGAESSAGRRPVVLVVGPEDTARVKVLLEMVSLGEYGLLKKLGTVLVAEVGGANSMILPPAVRRYFDVRVGASSPSAGRPAEESAIQPHDLRPTQDEADRLESIILSSYPIDHIRLAEQARCTVDKAMSFLRHPPKHLLIEQCSYRTTNGRLWMVWAVHHNTSGG